MKIHVELGRGNVFALMMVTLLVIVVSDRDTSVSRLMEAFVVLDVKKYITDVILNATITDRGT